jgi:hypothetical protein
LQRYHFILLFNLNEIRHFYDQSASDFMMLLAKLISC